MEYYITDFKVSKTNAVALEDCIMKKDSLVTAGSKMLNNFIAPFDATVVERLRSANIDVSGKTRMSEFGIGGVVMSRQDRLSGSAQAVIDNAVSCCLCNDFFGQYRREAAENNLCYIHPTYGTVSRFGLIPLVSSVDQIGVLSKDLADGFKYLSVIAGHDNRDGAMFAEKEYSYRSCQKSITAWLPSNITESAEEHTQNVLREFAQKFAAVNHNFDYFNICKQTMYVLSCAEISNNINRYDGVKFGYRAQNTNNLESLYTKTRTEAFETETKLAAIMGSMVLSAEQYHPYYEKAMKIRRLIKNTLCFDGYDVIILPTSLGDDSYENFSLYSIAALAGLPSVSFSYKGCGIQLIANVKQENALLTAWEVSR